MGHPYRSTTAREPSSRALRQDTFEDRVVAAVLIAAGVVLLTAGATAATVNGLELVLGLVLSGLGAATVTHSSAAERCRDDS